MQSPHESLSLSSTRGLLAAVRGTRLRRLGLVSLYDLSRDCRHPELQFTKPLARFGHESGFTPDGRTSTRRAPHRVDHGDRRHRHQEPARALAGSDPLHGMSLSDDGNRAYVADPTGRNMRILDVADPSPQTGSGSPGGEPHHVAAGLDPAERDPVHRDGHPYLVEVDEYNAATIGSGARMTSARRASSTSRTRRIRA